VIKRPLFLTGIMDWRALSATEARPSGISYRLASGKSGEITDPLALRTFYWRIYENQKQKEADYAGRGTPRGRSQTDAG
jgi:hypothetical protein